MKYSTLFIWQDIDGKTGEIPASTRNHAKQLLIIQGTVPVRIKAGVKLSRKCWPLSALSLVTRQLATMLQAGLTLSHCLGLIAAEHPQPAWRYLLKELQNQIAQGKAFSLALSEYPDAFPPLFCELIRTGELTGKLEQCCWLLAEQQDKLIKLQKKVRKALSYPIFILAVALLVVLLMLTLVLPAFSEIYQSFNAPLPWFTQSLIDLSDIIRDFGLLMLILISIPIVYYVKKLRPQLNWQQREQRLLLRLPLCGKLIQTNGLAKIFRTLAMTQQAGIPLTAGIKSAANASGNIQYLNALLTILKLIEQGSPLCEALRQQTLFPSLSHQLIRVGEESGTLDDMLNKLADIYETEAETLAENLSAKIEPLIMMILGVIIGGLVIAIYLPIFQLGNVMA
ncbi:type II secretion protein F [Pragia fontium]|uniref:Type II secretion protein F n=1 Tax=Pragia fontium TaxID=82985 RepID=A0ABQ5LHC1_9GAMM|nr:protein transport protein HofC [Pragia fontium]GKX63001.1 type II secretion protein F [Pragia fontium]